MSKVFETIFALFQKYDNDLIQLFNDESNSDLKNILSSIKQKLGNNYEKKLKHLFILFKKSNDGEVKIKCNYPDGSSEIITIKKNQSVPNEKTGGGFLDDAKKLAKKISTEIRETPDTNKHSLANSLSKKISTFQQKVSKGMDTVTKGLDAASKLTESVSKSDVTVNKSITELISSQEKRFDELSKNLELLNKNIIHLGGGMDTIIDQLKKLDENIKKLQNNTPSISQQPTTQQPISQQPTSQ